MSMLSKHSSEQQHMVDGRVLAYRKAQRKKDAMALAELIYDVFKEKKLKEKGIMEDGQNNAKQSQEK